MLQLRLWPELKQQNRSGEHDHTHTACVEMSIMALCLLGFTVGLQGCFSGCSLSVAGVSLNIDSWTVLEQFLPFLIFFFILWITVSSLSLYFLVKQGLLPRNCMWTALLEKHHPAGNYLYTDVPWTAGWGVNWLETIPGTLSHILQLPIVVFTTMQLPEVTSLSILLQRGTEHLGPRVIYWAEVHKLAVASSKSQVGDKWFRNDRIQEMQILKNCSHYGPVHKELE